MIRRDCHFAWIVSVSFLVAVFAFSTNAVAQSVDRPTEPTCDRGICAPAVSNFSKLGGRVLLLQQIFGGEDAEPLVRQLNISKDVVNEYGLEVTLRFRGPLKGVQKTKLRALGVDFAEYDGDLFRIGPIYKAFVPWEALEELSEMKGLVRAESIWVPRMSYPLEKTSRLVGASQARQNPKLGVSGEGVTIGDIDSGFDIFHPHFFRADGEYVEWVDANNNRIFDLGIDGVDLNGNGKIDDDEVLKLLDAERLDIRGGATGDVEGGETDMGEESDGTLDPEQDWLYVDQNGDGERNVGLDAGFKESDPAYSEPTFVVDDVDDNGYLDRKEKLVRLDTSKFKRIVDDGEVYERGEDLIEYGVPVERSSNYHGAGVASVLAGGQPQFHDRVGLAPGASVVGYVNGSQNFQGQNTNRNPDPVHVKNAIESNVDILLYEFGIIAMTSIDGSSNYEQAINRAVEEAGIPQITPMGNLNRAKKHASRTISKDKPAEFVFDVDEGMRTSRGRIPYSVVWGSLYWEKNQEPTIELALPGDKSLSLEIPESQSFQQRVGKHSIQIVYEKTPRGTRQAHFVIYNAENRRESIATGEWTLRVKNGNQEGKILGRVTDAYSSWSPGVGWKDFTPDKGTLVFPSTADKGVGVAAYGGRAATDGSPVGELRGYSGRGPRIDGKRMVDLTAPADPYVAFGLNERFKERGLSHGLFFQFGGTSGAGPHIAASYALMKDAHPMWAPSKITDRLTDTATAEDLKPAFGETPNPHWGHGKVDVYTALTDSEPSEDTDPPVAQLAAEQLDEAIELNASESNDKQSSSLEYRFDTDYDGAYETEWDTDKTHSFDTAEFESGTEIVSRVQVRDPAGNTKSALSTVVLGGTTQAEEAENTDVSETVSDAGDATMGGDSTGAEAEDGELTDLNEGSSNGDGDETEDNGCGCYSTAGSGAPVPVEWLLFIGVFAVLRRRRRT